jgi:anti-anti-sigma regulatory factor
VRSHAVRRKQSPLSSSFHSPCSQVVEQGLALARSARVSGIVIDMSRLHFIDETAAKSVLDAIARFRSTGGDLEISYPSPMASQLLEVCIELQAIGITFVEWPVGALPPSRPLGSPIRSPDGATEASSEVCLALS